MPRRSKTATSGVGSKPKGVSNLHRSGKRQYGSLLKHGRGLSALCFVAALAKPVRVCWQPRAGTVLVRGARHYLMFTSIPVLPGLPSLPRTRSASCRKGTKTRVGTEAPCGLT